MHLLLLLLACHPGGPVEPTAASESSALLGTSPAAPVAAPEFAAVAQDGSPRSKADLIGHPTVMWFFPAAGTPG